MFAGTMQSCNYMIISLREFCGTHVAGWRFNRNATPILSYCFDLLGGSISSNSRRSSRRC